jgi:hypothetical protein
MKAIGQITTGVAALTISAFWSGYVLSVLWTWFVVSQFSDAPRLSVAGAIGIAIIVGYLTKQDDASSSKANDLRTTEEKLFETGALLVLKPAFALFIGWIVQLFL